MGARESPDKR